MDSSSPPPAPTSSSPLPPLATTSKATAAPSKGVSVSPSIHQSVASQEDTDHHHRHRRKAPHITSPHPLSLGPSIGPSHPWTICSLPPPELHHYIQIQILLTHHSSGSDQQSLSAEFLRTEPLRLNYLANLVHSLKSVNLCANDQVTTGYDLAQRRESYRRLLKS